MKSYLLLYIISIVSKYGVTSVNPADPCENHKSCSACITDSNMCAWCAMEDTKGVNCKSIKSDMDTWCPELLQNPKSNISIEDNKEFSSDSDNIVQMKPQKLHLKLRVGEAQTFNFSFKAAKDYPVDLYFLLDLSYTMKDVKDMMTKQSKNIFNTLKDMTHDVRLGIGSFIDKNTLPFTSSPNSTKTYSFRNHLKLTNNSETFKEILDNISFGTNSDMPEGGLDALGQVLACGYEIGWREQSRKIIIFSTDAQSHAAGDGILAGITQPFDGKCYTKNDVYTKELEMDYPSVSMINKLAANIEAIIIFLVKRDAHSIYSDISHAIRGSKSISLTGNEVVATLRQVYQEITQTIKLKTNVKFVQNNNFDIKFEPDCSGSENKDNMCDVQIGKETHFSASIKLLEYSEIHNISIEIIIEGINERLRLDIEVINKCDCEGNGTTNSPACHSGGTLECGICQCNPNRYGQKCICEKNIKSRTAGSDNSTCIAEDSKMECSGRGSCICGACHCTAIGGISKYEGDYCEYDKDSCLRTNNTICSNRGSCVRGKCLCNPNWTGEACECRNDNTKCIKNNKMCNNRGECVCGACKCQDKPDWDARTQDSDLCTMSPCVDCYKTQCLHLEACAICLFEGNQSCSVCKPFQTNITEKLAPVDNSTWNICPEIRVEVGCYSQFMYQYDDDSSTIRLLVQKEKNCLESYYIYGGIALVTLLLVGVGTLVAWKILTDIRDRHEYSTFMNDRKHSVRENPLYNSPKIEIKNPTFEEK